MSLDIMAFVLGGLLVAAGLFGGGIEIKELKLPQISGGARIASTVIGVGFVVLALSINLKWIDPKGANPPSVDKTFEAPMFEGLRLDACVEWAKRCGEEAATAWCKVQGYNRATDYPIENVGERGVSTKLIGTNVVCKEKFCGSFSRITCVK